MIVETIDRYVARRFAFWFAAVFSSLAAIIFLLDLVEHVRRAQRSDAPLFAFVQLSLLKLPHLLMDAFPFVVLFAAMVCFGRLARTQELTVIRAAGISVWRFLGPVLLVVLAIGALRVVAAEADGRLPDRDPPFGDPRAVEQNTIRLEEHPVVEIHGPA